MIRQFRTYLTSLFCACSVIATPVVLSAPVFAQISTETESDIIRLIREAELGDSDSQRRLGERYYVGKGVEFSKTDAARWFEKAARQGDPMALNNIIAMYIDDEAVPQSMEEARAWVGDLAKTGNSYAKTWIAENDPKNANPVTWVNETDYIYQGENRTYASTDYDVLTLSIIRGAEEGTPRWQAVLGQRYSEGKGVTKSAALAMHWYHKAAAAGDASAAHDIGLMHFLGNGVETSKPQAATWFEKAARLGSEKAKRNAAALYLGNDVTPSNSREAVQWIKILADKGDAEASLWVAKSYATGKGVPESKFKAADYYQKAADAGLAEAQYELGRAYRYGIGRPQSDREALKWFGTSWDNHVPARYELGLLYETGAGGQYRPDDAAYLYNADTDGKSFRALERLANTGNAEAQILLSANYEIWKRDIVTAIDWEKKSADQGHPGALCKRGERFIEGRGVPQDMAEGIRLIRASADQFDPCGMTRMGILYLEGNGVEQSFEKAVNYLMSADRMHSADAGMRVDEAMMARRNELNEIAREKERIRVAAAERRRARERAAEAKRKHEAWKAERRRQREQAAATPTYSWEQGFRDMSPFRANGSYKTCSTDGNGKVSCN